MLNRELDRKEETINQLERSRISFKENLGAVKMSIEFLLNNDA